MSCNLAVHFSLCLHMCLSVCCLSVCCLYVCLCVVCMLSVCLCVVCMSLYCLCVVCMYVYVFRKADNNYPPPPQLSLFNITKRENSPPLVPQDRQRDQTRHIRPPSMTCQPPPTSVSGQPETTTQKYTHRSPHRNTPTGHHTEIHPHVTTQKYTHTSPHRNTPHVTRQKYTTCHKIT